MGKEVRSTEIEKDIRVMAIAKAILSGYTKRRFLLQYTSEKFENWGVSERQIDTYIKEAKEIIRNKYTDDDLEIEKDIALSRLESLFTMNMKIQDYRECRNVTMDRMKLMGVLIDKKEIELDSKLTDEDRERRIAELKSKMNL